ncbi:DUF2252 domain-containing protein [bacterium]|nr:DUF2252 domain-containing protein [bacterium]
MTIESGRALRSQIGRSSHAEWQPAPDRRDPIAILEESGQTRMQDLLPLRYGRMARSPFAFFRGAAQIMASDLQHTPDTGIRVQACGDCHLCNFGGFATPERRLVFDLNDFDETLPAAWEWDIKRLTASFVVAARANGSGRQQSEAALAAVAAYRQNIRNFLNLSPLECWYESVDVQSILEDMQDSEWRKQVRKEVQKNLKRTLADHYLPKLTDQHEGRLRIRDNPPVVYHLPEHLDAEILAERLPVMLEGYRSSLSEERRDLLNRYRFVDCAVKVVGVGSVGTRCLIVLLMAEDRHPLFLQIKQANQSVLEPYFGPDKAHQGERVVVGQRRTQAASDLFLGWTQDALGRQYYVRQLRDVKMSADVSLMTARRLKRYAELCGRVLARAHARLGAAPAIAGYLGRGDRFDKAIAQFALRYADQTESDHAALLQAIQDQRLPVFWEED